VEHLHPEGVIIWHGMVRLPEILHALCDFKGKVLVHAGNPAYSMPRWVDWRYWLREKALGSRCLATYVCCSQYVANSLEHSRYLRRFPRAVVFNGVKPLTVPPHTPREIRSGASFTIGMTARLDHIKDHATLLRAFALLSQGWPTVSLELAGAGEQRSTLEKLAKGLGIVEQVRFLGSVPDVYAVMQHWDIFAYATTNKEGLGNALAEAMLLGLPCVVTDVGPMREVGGDAVSYVTERDAEGLSAAIGALTGEWKRRREMQVTGLARALNEFSAASFAEGYLAILEQEY
jgi:glycosyltransferase involved in cell wall biosynthesis